jgi:phosphonate transport system substrate-binding protein
VLGFLPSARAEEVIPKAERLGAFLSLRLGREVRVVVPSTYEPLIEGFRFGHVHAAFLDGGPGWIAHKRAGAEVILAEVKNGNTYYWAEAFVRADSPLKEIGDAVGKRIAFTSRTGSSGFLMPIGSMIDAGFIKPRGPELVDLENALSASFASTSETGGYKQALTALIENRADVAFGAHDAPERFLDVADRGRVRTLHRFGRIPSHSILVSRTMDPALRELLRAALLELNAPENVQILRDLYGVDGLREANTEEHLGDFGRALGNLPGMERTLVARSGS